MKNFILPEKWCIKVTKENSLIVGKKFGKVSTTYLDWYDNNSIIYRTRPYLKSHNDSGDSYLDPNIPFTFSHDSPEGLELTTEEFIEYVLNKKQTVKVDSDLENIYKKLLNIT
jgi:hypothetical protein